MPDRKISELTDGQSIQPGDRFIISRGNANHAITGDRLLNQVDFTLGYTDGLVTSVDYSSGDDKTLSYTNGVLTSVTVGSTTKTLTYSPDGSLSSVTHT